MIPNGRKFKCFKNLSFKRLTFVLKLDHISHSQKSEFLVMEYFNSPLEQFEVNSLLKLFFFSNTGEMSVLILFSNANLFMLIVTFFLFFSFRFFSLNAHLVPATTFQTLIEFSVSFVGNMLKENTASTNRIFLVFTPYVFTVFSFILVSNFVGMVPYSFTVTSSFVVTFSIAGASFIGINIIGARTHKLGFLAIFLPPGCPLFISPFIILIETVSYIARVFSLSIRLFANMMAGHTLLKILAGFS